MFGCVKSGIYRDNCSKFIEDFNSSNGPNTLKPLEGGKEGKKETKKRKEKRNE